MHLANNVAINPVETREKVEALCWQGIASYRQEKYKFNDI